MQMKPVRLLLLLLTGMETDLGLRLFDRHTRMLKLTLAGAEILPLARTRGGRARLAAVSGVVLAATLYGAAPLGEAWESGLRRGEFADLPIGVLVALTAAVAVSIGSGWFAAAAADLHVKRTHVPPLRTRAQARPKSATSASTCSLV